MIMFSMKYKKFLSIPVLAVFLLMGFVYYVTIFVFIEDWAGLQGSAGSLNALIFTSMVSLCVFSFFVCVLTDPGHVPSSYAPDVEGTGRPDQESNKNLMKAKRFHNGQYLLSVLSTFPWSFTGNAWTCVPHGRRYGNRHTVLLRVIAIFMHGEQFRQCDKCCTFKPPRAHHCRVCRRCVLRMDHHCIWINNCVGYWNYKAFFALVLYATAGSIYSMVIVISSAFQTDFTGRVALKVFNISYGVMTVALSLTLGTLLGWHLYLIAHNMTTIEYYEGIRAAWLARKSGLNYRHPFDVSAYKNITLVLGSNMLKWFCPTAVSHLRDGINFPTSHDS